MAQWFVYNCARGVFHLVIGRQCFYILTNFGDERIERAECAVEVGIRLNRYFVAFTRFVAKFTTVELPNFAQFARVLVKYFKWFSEWYDVR